MNEILTPSVIWWAKVAAGLVAIVVAWSSRGDSLRRVFTWFTPRRSRERIAQANMDSAWRELMDDSITRNCGQSVELLNSWMQARTTGRLPTQDRSK